jgi:hypothetical protein
MSRLTSASNFVVEIDSETDLVRKGAKRDTLLGLLRFRLFVLEIKCYAISVTERRMLPNE